MSSETNFDGVDGGSDLVYDAENNEWVSPEELEMRRALRKQQQEQAAASQPIQQPTVVEQPISDQEAYAGYVDRTPAVQRQEVPFTDEPPVMPYEQALTDGNEQVARRTEADVLESSFAEPEVDVEVEKPRRTEMDVLEMPVEEDQPVVSEQQFLDSLPNPFIDEIEPEAELEDPMMSEADVLDMAAIEAQQSKQIPDNIFVDSLNNDPQGTVAGVLSENYTKRYFPNLNQAFIFGPNEDGSDVEEYSRLVLGNLEMAEIQKMRTKMTVLDEAGNEIQKEVSIDEMIASMTEAEADFEAWNIQHPDAIQQIQQLKTLIGSNPAYVQDDVRELIQWYDAMLEIPKIRQQTIDQKNQAIQQLQQSLYQPDETAGGVPQLTEGMLYDGTIPIVQQFVSARQAAKAWSDAIPSIGKDNRGTFFLNQYAEAMRSRPELAPVLEAQKQALIQVYGFTEDQLQAAVHPQLIQMQEVVDQPGLIEAAPTDPVQLYVANRTGMLESQMMAILNPTVDQIRQDFLADVKRTTPELKDMDDQQILDLAASTKYRKLDAKVENLPPFLQERDGTEDPAYKALQSYIDRNGVPNELLADKDHAGGGLIKLVGQGLKAGGAFMGSVISQSPGASTAWSATKYGAEKFWNGNPFGERGVGEGLLDALDYAGTSVVGAAAILAIHVDKLGDMAWFDRQQHNGEMWDAWHKRSDIDQWEIMREAGGTVIWNLLTRSDAGVEMAKDLGDTNVKRDDFIKKWKNPAIELAVGLGVGLFIDPLVIGARAIQGGVKTVGLVRAMESSRKMNFLKIEGVKEYKEAVEATYKIGEFEQRYGRFIDDTISSGKATDLHSAVRYLAAHPEDVDRTYPFLRALHRTVVDIPFMNRPEARIPKLTPKMAEDYLSMIDKVEGTAGQPKQLADLIGKFHNRRGGQVFPRLAAQEWVDDNVPANALASRSIPDAFINNHNPLPFSSYRSNAAARNQASLLAEEFSRTFFNSSAMSHFSPLHNDVPYAKAGQMYGAWQEAKKLVGDLKKVENGIFGAPTAEELNKAWADWGTKLGFQRGGMNAPTRKTMVMLRALGDASFEDEQVELLKAAEEATAVRNFDESTVYAMGGYGQKWRTGDEMLRNVVDAASKGIRQGVFDGIPQGTISWKIPFADFNMDVGNWNLVRDGVVIAPNPLTYTVGKVLTKFPQMERARPERWISDAVTTFNDLVEPQANMLGMKAQYPLSEYTMREIARRYGVKDYESLDEDGLWDRISAMTARKYRIPFKPSLVPVKNTGTMSDNYFSMGEIVQYSLQKALSFGFLNTPRFVIRNYLNNNFTLMLDGVSPSNRMYDLFKRGESFLSTDIKKDLTNYGLGKQILESGGSSPYNQLALRNTFSRFEEVAESGSAMDILLGRLPAFIKNPIHYAALPADLATPIEQMAALRAIRQGWTEAYNVMSPETTTNWTKRIADEIFQGKYPDIQKSFEAAAANRDPKEILRWLDDFANGQLPARLDQEQMSPETAKLATDGFKDELQRVLDAQVDSVSETLKAIRQAWRSDWKQIGTQLETYRDAGGSLVGFPTMERTIWTGFIRKYQEFRTSGLNESEALEAASHVAARWFDKALSDASDMAELWHHVDLARNPNAMIGQQGAENLSYQLMKAIDGQDAERMILQAIGPVEPERVRALADVVMNTWSEDFMIRQSLIEDSIYEYINNVKPMNPVDLSNADAGILLYTDAGPRQMISTDLNNLPPGVTNPTVLVSGHLKYPTRTSMQDEYEAMTAANQTAIRNGGLPSRGGVDDQHVIKYLTRRSRLWMPAATPIGIGSLAGGLNPLADQDEQQSSGFSLPMAVVGGIIGGGISVGGLRFLADADVLKNPKSAIKSGRFGPGLYLKGTDQQNIMKFSEAAGLESFRNQLHVMSPTDGKLFDLLMNTPEYKGIINRINTGKFKLPEGQSALKFIIEDMKDVAIRGGSESLADALGQFAKKIDEGGLPTEPRLRIYEGSPDIKTSDDLLAAQAVLRGSVPNGYDGIRFLDSAGKEKVFINHSGMEKLSGVYGGYKVFDNLPGQVESGGNGTVVFRSLTDMSNDLKHRGFHMNDLVQAANGNLSDDLRKTFEEPAYGLLDPETGKVDPEKIHAVIREHRRQGLVEIQQKWGGWLDSTTTESGVYRGRQLPETTGMNEQVTDIFPEAASKESNWNTDYNYAEMLSAMMRYAKKFGYGTFVADDAGMTTDVLKELHLPAMKDLGVVKDGAIDWNRFDEVADLLGEQVNSRGVQRFGRVITGDDEEHYVFLSKHDVQNLNFESSRFRWLDDTNYWQKNISKLEPRSAGTLQTRDPNLPLNQTDKNDGSYYYVDSMGDEIDKGTMTKAERAAAELEQQNLSSQIEREAYELGPSERLDKAREFVKANTKDVDDNVNSVRDAKWRMERELEALKIEARMTPEEQTKLDGLRTQMTEMTQILRDHEDQKRITVAWFDEVDKEMDEQKAFIRGVLDKRLPGWADEDPDLDRALQPASTKDLYTADDAGRVHGQANMRMKALQSMVADILYAGRKDGKKFDRARPAFRKGIKVNDEGENRNLLYAFEDWMKGRRVDGELVKPGVEHDFFGTKKNFDQFMPDELGLMHQERLFTGWEEAGWPNLKQLATEEYGNFERQIQEMFLAKDADGKYTALTEYINTNRDFHRARAAVDRLDRELSTMEFSPKVAAQKTAQLKAATVEMQQLQSPLEDKRLALMDVWKDDVRGVQVKDAVRMQFDPNGDWGIKDVQRYLGDMARGDHTDAIASRVLDFSHVVDWAERRLKNLNMVGAEQKRRFRQALVDKYDHLMGQGPDEALAKTIEAEFRQGLANITEYSKNFMRTEKVQLEMLLAEGTEGLEASMRRIGIKPSGQDGIEHPLAFLHERMLDRYKPDAPKDEWLQPAHFDRPGQNAYRTTAEGKGYLVNNPKAKDGGFKIMLPMPSKAEVHDDVVSLVDGLAGRNNRWVMNRTNLVDEDGFTYGQGLQPIGKGRDVGFYNEAIVIYPSSREEYERIATRLDRTLRYEGWQFGGLRTSPDDLGGPQPLNDGSPVYYHMNLTDDAEGLPVADEAIERIDDKPRGGYKTAADYAMQRHEVAYKVGLWNLKDLDIEPQTVDEVRRSVGVEAADAGIDEPWSTVNDRTVDEVVKVLDVKKGKRGSVDRVRGAAKTKRQIQNVADTTSNQKFVADQVNQQNAVDPDAGVFQADEAVEVKATVAEKDTKFLDDGTNDTRTKMAEELGRLKANSEVSKGPLRGPSKMMNQTAKETPEAPVVVEPKDVDNVVEPGTPVDLTTRQGPVGGVRGPSTMMNQSVQQVQGPSVPPVQGTPASQLPGPTASPVSQSGGPVPRIVPPTPTASTTSPAAKQAYFVQGVNPVPQTGLSYVDQFEMDPAVGNPLGNAGLMVRNALLNRFHAEKVWSGTKAKAMTPAIETSGAAADANFNVTKLHQLVNDFADAKWRDHATSFNIGKRLADYMLHNYGNTNDLDTMMRWLIPWGFWTTRSSVKYLERMMDRPWAMGLVGKTFNFLDEMDDEGLPEDLKERFKGKFGFGPAEDMLARAVGVSGMKFATDPRRMIWPVDMMGFGESPLSYGRQDADLYFDQSGNYNNVGKAIMNIQQVTGGFSPILTHLLYQKNLIHTENYTKYLDDYRKDSITLPPALQSYNRIFMAFTGQGGEVAGIPLGQTTYRDMKSSKKLLQGWYLSGKISEDEMKNATIQLDDAWRNQSLWGGTLGILGKVKGVDGIALEALEHAQKVNLTSFDGAGSLTGVSISAIYPGEIQHRQLASELGMKSLQEGYQAVYNRYGRKGLHGFVYDFGDGLVIDKDKDGKYIERMLSPDEVNKLVLSKAMQQADLEPANAEDLIGRAAEIKDEFKGWGLDTIQDKERLTKYFTAFASDDSASKLRMDLAINEYFAGMGEVYRKYYDQPLQQHLDMYGPDHVERQKIKDKFYNDVLPQERQRIMKEIEDTIGVIPQVRDTVTTWEEFYADKIRTVVKPENFMDQDGVISFEGYAAAESMMLNLVPESVREGVAAELSKNDSVQTVGRKVVSELMSPVLAANKALQAEPDSPEKLKAVQDLEASMKFDVNLLIDKIHEGKKDWSKSFIAFYLAKDGPPETEQDMHLIEMMSKDPAWQKAFIEEAMGDPHQFKDVKQYYALFSYEKERMLEEGVIDKFRMPNGVVVQSGKTWTDQEGNEHTPERNYEAYQNAKKFQELYNQRPEGAEAYNAIRYGGDEANQKASVDYEYFFGSGPTGAYLVQEIQKIQPVMDSVIQLWNDDKKETGPTQAMLNLYYHGQMLKESLNAVRNPSRYMEVLAGYNKNLAQNGVVPENQLLKTPGGFPLGDAPATDKNAMASVGFEASRDHRIDINTTSGEVTLDRRDYFAYDNYNVSSRSSLGPSARNQTSQRYVPRTSSSSRSSRSSSGNRGSFDPYPNGRYEVTDHRGVVRTLPYRMAEDPAESVKGLIAGNRQPEFRDSFAKVEEYVGSLYGFYLDPEKATDDGIRSLWWERFSTEWPEITALIDKARTEWPGQDTMSNKALRYAAQQTVIRRLTDDIRMKEGRNKLFDEAPSSKTIVDPEPDSLVRRLSSSFIERNQTFDAVRDQVIAAFGYPNLANTERNRNLPLQDRQYLAAESYHRFVLAHPDIERLMDAAEAGYTGDEKHRQAVVLNLLNQIFKSKGMPELPSLGMQEGSRLTYVNAQGGIRQDTKPTTNGQLLQDASRNRVNLRPQENVRPGYTWNEEQQRFVDPGWELVRQLNRTNPTFTDGPRKKTGPSFFATETMDMFDSRKKNNYE